MEIKKLAIMIGIDNEKMRLEWRVRVDYGSGFMEVTKTQSELKDMLNKIISGMVDIKEKTI